MRCAVHWREQSTVALTHKCVTLVFLLALFSFLVLFLKSLHALYVVLERIRSLLDLAATNWRQDESGELIYVRLSCINLSACFACKVLFCGSVLQCLSTHHCAVDHHVLVDVALSEVADRAKCDFLNWRYIFETYVNLLFELHLILLYLVLLHTDDLSLHGDETLFHKLQELLRKVMEA
jgi:hypothetical protein